MLYRFKSKLATQDRLEAFVVGIPGSGKAPYIPPPKDYESKFSCYSNEMPFSKISFFNAPEFDEKTQGICLRFNPDKAAQTLPDILGIGSHLICSSRFKKVIEEIDEFIHQFIPIVIFDHQEKPIKTEASYYWFNLRRFVKIHADAAPSPKNIYFVPTKEEELFLGSIIEIKSISDQLMDIPIWRYFGEDTQFSRNTSYRQVFYLNDILVKQLRNAGITGIESYSKPNGHDEEAIVEITFNRGEGI